MPAMRGWPLAAREPASPALVAEQRELDLRLQALHEEYVPGVALAWIESVYPYRKGWENWVIDPMYGGVVNSFSWFTVTRAE